jgi:hypothetical protein
MTDAQSTSRLPPVTLDNSQSSQDLTSARLPTPPQQTFCEPCKAFLRGDVTDCLNQTDGLLIATLSTSIILMRSLSNGLLSFLASSAFGSKRLSKGNLVYPATSERVVTADLCLGRSHHTAYTTGPTHYGYAFTGISFSSHDVKIAPVLEPYECKKSDD